MVSLTLDDPKGVERRLRSLVQPFLEPSWIEYATAPRTVEDNELAKMFTDGGEVGAGADEDAEFFFPQTHGFIGCEELAGEVIAVFEFHEAGRVFPELLLRLAVEERLMVKF